MRAVRTVRPGGAAAVLPGPAAATVAATAKDAAKMAYAPSATATNPLSERKLADRFGIPRSRARRIRAEIARQADGHHPPPQAEVAA